VATLAIRTSALVTIALFLTWYAPLGGWRALIDALPEIGPLAPRPSSAPVNDPTEIPLGLFIQPVLLVVALMLIRFARARRVTASHGRTASPIERRLWADHLAWLAEISRGSEDATSAT
jgi:hypothetical protein